jgi:hypothetical protein
MGGRIAATKVNGVRRRALRLAAGDGETAEYWFLRARSNLWQYAFG